MEKKKDIDAVEMTRRIRDAHAEELTDASPAERIHFFREKARRVHARFKRESRRADSAPSARRR